ncbi:MAG: tail fiber domain-containing protein [Vicinamibacterales bacterium]
MSRVLVRASVMALSLAALAAPAPAQTLGTFSWQLAPFCNVVTVAVTQNGSSYTLDGYDSQCGAGTRAPATGMAVLNPDGTVEIGLTIVTSPGGTPVHVDTTIDLASLGGPWTDSLGHTGTLIYGGAGGGSPRPLAAAALRDGSVDSATIADGSIAAVDIDASEVQRRIATACPSGQLMTGVAEDGSVACEAVSSTSGGDITAVSAGTGLSGGGLSGAVTVSADFAAVQARLTGNCPANQYLRGVGPTGTPQCDPVSNAANAAQLGGVAANQYVVTSDVRLTNARTPLPGSADYVRNNVSSAQTANFNISGNGVLGGTLTAGAVMTQTAFGIGGTPRIFGHYGVNNLFAGALAASAEEGIRNTIVGDSAGSQIDGEENAFVGFLAGQFTTTGDDNTFVGSRAGNQNLVGGLNTYVGRSAGLLSTGSDNTVLGALALDQQTSGDRNTAVGKGALTALQTGTQNIAIGWSAGSTLLNGDNNVYLGGTAAAVESGTIRVGTALQTRFFTSGVRGITTGNNNAVPVVIDSAGQLGTVSSSRRTKFDIDDLPGGVTHALQALRPVQFRYRQAFADGSTPIQYGLIAEEVEEVMPELVAYDEAGAPMTVKYHVLPSLLLADVQRLERERRREADLLQRQQDRIAQLEEELAALKALLLSRTR